MRWWVRGEEQREGREEEPPWLNSKKTSAENFRTTHTT